jgi:hypothetical protein
LISKNEVEDRVRRIEVDDLRARQHAVQVLRERLPAAGRVAAPPEHLEVVDDDEAALLDVGAQRRSFAVAQRPPADLDDVRDRYLFRSGSSRVSTLTSSDRAPRKLMSFMIRIRFCSAIG